MRTRQRHVVSIETQNAVISAKTGSWVNTARSLGFEAEMGVTLSAVAHGKTSAVSLAGENLIRRALRLPDIPAVLITACPTCGGDHGLRGIPDCHGQPVAAVVTLAPGQRVARQRQPAAPRTLSDYPVSVLHAMIAEREAYRGSAAQ